MLPRRDTVSGRQLKIKWGLDIHQLSYLLLKHDISVLEPSIIPTIKFRFDPSHYKLDLEYLLDIIQNNPSTLNEKLFWLPEIEQLTIKKDISSIKAKVHSKWALSAPIKGRDSRKKQNVNFRDIRFMRCKSSRAPALYKLRDSEISKSEPPSQAENHIIKDVIEEHENDVKQHSNVFSLIGKVWFVKFHQKEWGLYPDQKKYKYLAYLLNLSTDIDTSDNPEISISNLDLHNCVNPSPYQKDKSKYFENSRDELNFDEDLSIDEKRLIEKTLRKLINRIELAKDFDDDDEKMKDLAEEEFSEYVRHLKQRGIWTIIKDGGNIIKLKPKKRLNAKNEKIRQKIKNNIRNVNKDLKDKMPAFVEHLEHFCKIKLSETIYRPIPPTNWFVSF